jgi:RNA polymerase sigma-70 factor (ECF subfamily)
MSAPAPSADDMKHWLKAVAEHQDRAAFGRLFQYFAPRIVSFMERSGLNAAEAEEISQETMVAVWRKAALYDPAQAGVSTWVFTIARNLRVDLARKASRASAGVAAMRELPARLEASVEDMALASERDARVRSAMATLSPEQATVLRLSFFAEKPHAEIARELSLPLGTVKSRTRLAMAKIRAILEREP